MQIPRLMIAGTHSGVGKTTIATGVMAALSKRGYNVQPYKVGPDYIDPSYHNIATGNICRNLDTWMLDEDTVRSLFTRSAAEAEIAVIEGVMGLYDGASGVSDAGSPARVAKILDCPVVLVVDVQSMARSAAAVVMGFQKMDPGVNIAGVILNRIGSDRHLRLVSEAIATNCDIPVIGYVRKNAGLSLPSRHLGLVPTAEGGELFDIIGALADNIAEGVNFEMLAEIAQKAGSMPEETAGETPGFPGAGGADTAPVRVAIARDEAFSFYYQDGLEVLESCGVELAPFSPLHDCDLPANIDGIYIGGGFPEVFARQLAENSTIKEQIKKSGLNKMPVYAECGGLMYLTEAVCDFDGQEYPMTGLIPAKCHMQKKLAGMGYVTVKQLTDTLLGPGGYTYRGHEFHYSRLEPAVEGFKWACKLTRNKTGETVYEGYTHDNILATYVHLHFAADPALARNFAAKCRKYREVKKKVENDAGY